MKSGLNITGCLITIFSLLMLYQNYYAYPSGVSGFTQKSGTAGCGACHSTHSSANTIVMVQLSGPATLEPGETGTYSAVISGGSGSGVGIDIAASTGTLTPVSPSLKLQNGELTQSSRQRYSAGQYTFNFTYTAPSAEGTQTIYATGMSDREQWNFAPNLAITVTNATDVKDNSIIKVYSLEQNYPNPFNPETVIAYELPQASDVELVVTDVLGREVAQLVNGYQESGRYRVNFNGSVLSNGIYFYRIRAGSFESVKKMVIAK